MSENKNKSKMNQKNSKNLARILRRLAQSENLLTNKIKITILEGEIIEEKNKFFIAPLMFKSFSEQSVDQISTENASVKTIYKNSKEEEKISSSDDIVEVDYPESSDFSDDE